MNPYDILFELYQKALPSVMPGRLLRDAVRLDGNVLVVQDSIRYRLDDYRKIMVVSTGKGAMELALTIEDMLGDRIDEGLAITRHGLGKSLRKFRVMEAAHPVPDQLSMEAGSALLDFASRADEHTLVICLLSGGTSSLVTSSIDPAITLDRWASLTKSLLQSGATIDEINAVRKHLSATSGGRLAKVLYPATVVSLIVSDVIGDRPDVIASGITAPDQSTWQDVSDIVLKYNLRLCADGFEETPKPGDPIFDRVTNVIIGSNRTMLDALSKEIRECGYRLIRIDEPLTGEAKDAAKYLFDIASKETGPAILLAGGETTVTLGDEYGKGGRNQELALRFLDLMKERNLRDVSLLSVSTDGMDGPTDAAGAYAGFEVIDRAEELSLTPTKFLRKHDAYTFFDRTGFLCRTGMTGTNVCDVQMIFLQEK